MEKLKKSYDKPLCELVNIQNDCVLCTSVGLDNINETTDVIVWDE